MLHNGTRFAIPREKLFASDVYVTEGNVDWNSEYILCAYLKTVSGKGDFLDVGAHIGYYSCLVGSYVNRVWAFEPDTRNHKYLDSAFRDLDNVTIVKSAVSDVDGEIGFSDNGESSVSHIDNSPQELVHSLVPVVKLDTFVAEHGLSPIAIKIDIEGFEILALAGTKETLKKNKTVLLVEYNQEEDRPNTWDGLQKLVNETDYSLFAVTREPLGWNDYTYQFREHKAKSLEPLSSKMIFLVPNSSKQWFQSFCDDKGTWTGDGLRPSSIRSLLQ